ncbi:alpha/beta fold hydrolase [Pokkaliibacter sp. MBI-7]|uniref:alpha/beta hydrolase family protein n=1 Tax=Pokkaliibacter sp. MBI-7 TaxID=3040600 RepID=UPI0024490092|nr:alpha/beta fold hydrolase [Pokkaliibacter sp. MBI-7]MDH2432716.1 alpha/beta fold hydrolase [Pokkaliibacter sp. MBI-7]
MSSAQALDTPISHPRPITTVTADGTTLHGTFYPAAAPRSTPSAVLICSGTGIKQGFYRSFAQWLSERGHDVLTFDYRGIGASLHETHVRHSKARKQDWGQQDIPAMLEWLARESGLEQVTLFGHSAGGQFTGVIPNYQRIARMVGVASSTGYIGYSPLHFRLLAGGLLKLYMPLANGVLGYTPCQWIGWGEDLPPGVARQWSQWCSSPGYVANALGTDIQQDYHQQLQLPMTFIHAVDDPIATRGNVADLTRLYPAAQIDVQTLIPAQYGLKHIGHIDFFRRSHQGLWPLLARAIEE